MSPAPRQNQGERLGALEEGYEALGREIHGLRRSFENFATEVRSELSDRKSVV